MWNRDRWVEIFETIKRNKLRTILSGFTVALGIFIFVTLFGFGNGLKNAFQQFFLDDATNTISVYSGKTTKPYKGFKSNRSIQFKNEDLTNITEQFPKQIQYITPRITRSGLVSYKTESNFYPVLGVSPGHQFAENTIIESGRYISAQDVKDKTKFAVIGRLVAQDLFGNDPPLGQYIEVIGSAFKVIGVFSDQGGDNEERMLYIPFTTRQQLSGQKDFIDMMIVAFYPEIGYAGALDLENKMRKYLKQKHQINPLDSGGIYLRNISQDLKQNQQFAGVLQLIVTFVGLGTLIAGIIGISNIMVYVIKERTKEIGIRKAIGATPKEVIGMILQESILITIISGYFGLFLGIITLKIIGTRLEDYFIINPYIDVYVAITATIILILFGAIAGYIPAKRAAEIRPIVALRND